MVLETRSSDSKEASRCALTKDFDNQMDQSKIIIASDQEQHRQKCLCPRMKPSLNDINPGLPEFTPSSMKHGEKLKASKIPCCPVDNFEPANDESDRELSKRGLGAYRNRSLV